MGRPPLQCYGPYIRVLHSQTRGNPCDYSRVYWCTCTLSSNPVHVAHVAGDAAPGLRGPGNVASQSYRRGWSPSIQIPG